MSFNLIESAKGLFNNELVSKAASYLGETNEGTTKALSAVIPSIGTGLSNIVSTTEGASTIIKLAQEYHQSGILNNLESFFSTNNSDLISKACGVLSNLFGSKSDRLTSLIADFSGIKNSSSGTLLSMALPAILGLLGKHAANSPAGASSIRTVLNHQYYHITNETPSGFNLGFVFNNIGSKTINNIKDNSAATASYVENAAGDTGSILKWLLPLLILALIAVVVWYFLKDGCNKKTTGVILEQTGFSRSSIFIIRSTWA